MGIANDDRRHFAFEVVQHVRVLAVNGAPSAVGRLDELYFLKTALSASPGEESPVHLDVVDPAGLASAELAEYPVVVLANVESLSAPAIERLEGFVDAGGRLLFFLGDKVAPQFYNASFAARPINE